MTPELIVNASAAVLSVTVAVIGWSVNSKRNRALQRESLAADRLLQQQNHKKDRALQRKQLAIQVLHENRYEEMWVKGLHVAFTAARDHDSEFFRSLITRHLDKNQELSKEEQEIRQGIQLVMNAFEFIAIGILNKAIDEDIVKWSFGNLYKKLYDVLSAGYIPVLRHPEGAHEVYINFTTLVERWNPDVQKVPDIARQT